MKQVTLIVFLSFLYSFVFSQKVSRAYNAMIDGKTDKALELFSKVIEKNPDEVTALVGYARTIYDMATIFKNSGQNVSSKITQLAFESSIMYLKQSEKYYAYIDEEDKKFISEKLLIKNLPDIVLLKFKLSEYLWSFHYNLKNNIDTIEYFEKNLSFGVGTQNEVNKKLSNLYYNAAKKSNTIRDYNIFISKFQNSSEARSALKDIEELETQNAILNPHIDTLESLIKKYPENIRIPVMQEKLAWLYLSTFDNNSSIQAIKSVRNKIEKLTRIDRQQMLDSCDIIMTKSECKRLLSSDNIYNILSFIEANRHFTTVDFEPLKRHKNELVTKYLFSSDNMNYFLLTQFCKELPITNGFANEILTKATLDLKGKCLECINSTLLNFINRNLQVNDNLSNALLNVLQKNLNISLHSITNEYLFSACQTIQINDQTHPIKAIVNSLGVHETMLKENLYITPVNDNWDLICIIKVNTDGKVKRQYYFLNHDDVYDLLPEIKLSAPIYVAIKQRFGVVSFTPPKIYRQNESGFEVLVYGYTASNQSCCPAYEININYKYENKNLTPLVANYINSYNYSLVQENLNSYYNINSEISSTAFENCMMNYPRQTDNAHSDLMEENKYVNP